MTFRYFPQWHGEREPRLIAFFQNPDILDADRHEHSEKAEEGQKKDHKEKKNTLNSDKDVADRMGKSMKALDAKLAARDKKLDNVHKRLEDTKAAAAKQRPALETRVSTGAAQTSQTIDRPETDKERASRKRVNDSANAIAGGLAVGLTAGLGEYGEAELKGRRVKVKQDVVGDASSTEQPDKKKTAVENQPTQAVAKTDQQPTQKAGTEVQRPQAESLAKGAADAKEQRQQAALETGVKEGQGGQAA